MDEAENETAGRGMIANREIKEGDELFAMPISMLLTKEAAKNVRGKQRSHEGACNNGGGRGEYLVHNMQCHSTARSVL